MRERASFIYEGTEKNKTKEISGGVAFFLLSHIVRVFCSYVAFLLPNLSLIALIVQKMPIATENIGQKKDDIKISQIFSYPQKKKFIRWQK